jgi:hypothetical protein
LSAVFTKIIPFDVVVAAIGTDHCLLQNPERFVVESTLSFYAIRPGIGRVSALEFPSGLPDNTFVGVFPSILPIFWDP